MRQYVNYIYLDIRCFDKCEMYKLQGGEWLFAPTPTHFINRRRGRPRICRLGMNSSVAEIEQWRRFELNTRVVIGWTPTTRLLYICLNLLKRYPLRGVVFLISFSLAVFQIKCLKGDTFVIAPTSLAKLHFATLLFNLPDASVHLRRLQCSIINDAGVQLKRHIREKTCSTNLSLQLMYNILLYFFSAWSI